MAKKNLNMWSRHEERILARETRFLTAFGMTK